MFGKDVEPFQILNFLDNQNFNKILIDKKQYFNSDKRIYLNGTYSESKIGIFTAVCDSIKNVLLEKGFNNPKVLDIEYIIHVEKRKYMPFHKHNFNFYIDPYKGYDPNNTFKTPFESLWVAIFYPHNITDSKFQGKLVVKKAKDDEGVSFQAIPNSIIFHNALYGHEVYFEDKDHTQFRDVWVTQWIC